MGRVRSPRTQPRHPIRIVDNMNQSELCVLNHESHDFDNHELK